MRNCEISDAETIAAGHWNEGFIPFEILQTSEVVEWLISHFDITKVLISNDFEGHLFNQQLWGLALAS